MSHKVHPKSFRIKEIADWQSRGFYGKKISQKLEEDFAIREFLKNKIGKLGVEKNEIERSANKINIIIYSARPGLLIGRGGEGIELLKKELEKKVFKNGKPEIKIEIKEVKSIWSSGPLVAQWMASQIEKRVSFRRVLKQARDKVMITKGVEGVRVELAGRLDGSEIARTEWLKSGKLPKQTIRADIDFAKEKAHCTYGIVGIKVWIYKGLKF
ncbi:MAG: 30S ribosomal protein S3 [Candidatus Nealsonbacteria bacterium]|nr:30S ribosomal protein S3 [Candidatus Nealsonbacteria bacterium]